MLPLCRLLCSLHNTHSSYTLLYSHPLFAVSILLSASASVCVCAYVSLLSLSQVRALLVENTFRSIDDIALMLAQNVTGFQAPWLFRPLIYVLNCRLVGWCALLCCALLCCVMLCFKRHHTPCSVVGGSRVCGFLAT